MLHSLKRDSIYFLIFLFSSGCLVDVEENVKVRTLDIKSLEVLTQNISFSQYDTIPQITDFPIVGWRFIPSQNVKIEHFQDAKEAGLTVGLIGFANADNLQKALDMAKEVGLKIIIRSPEMYNNTEGFVRKFKNHPANAGYFLQDEPSALYLPSLKDLAEKIESIDNTRFTYINLLPNLFSSREYAIESYEEYVRQFVNNVPLKILSFDYYPIVSNFIRPSWYNNLEFISSEAKKADIPFWAFALTSAHWDYPVPTIEHLRMQVYSNLAYGAKGIQYFTFWIPVEKEEFTSAPIDRSGNKTNEYYLLQQMNKEIHRYAYIFQTSKVNKVSHYGDIPEGTTQFSNAPYFMRSIDIRGGNALLSEMENDDNSFFMIQNTNLNKEIGITIQPDEQTQIILKNGSIIPASLIKEEFKLTPGDMVMFMR